MAVQGIVDGVQLDGAAVQVKSGASSTVTLHARARVSIEGRVHELASGAPVSGASCRASLEMGGREAAVITTAPHAPLSDANGRFTVEAPVGRVRVTCGSGDVSLSESAADVDVTADSTLHVDLVAVREIQPGSNPGIGLETSVLPPTVSSIAIWVPAGVAVGDQIVAIDGTSVANLGPLAAVYLILNHRIGSPVVLQLLRAGTPVTFQYDVRPG